MWNLKDDTNELVYKTESTHRHTKQIRGFQGEGLGGVEWTLGLADANHYIEWINNKILLYSTRHYIQYPGIHHNGKQF